MYACADPCVCIMKLCTCMYSPLCVCACMLCSICMPPYVVYACPHNYQPLAHAAQGYGSRYLCVCVCVCLSVDLSFTIKLAP